MACEVEDCTSPHFTTYTKYAAHWRLQHVQFVKITFCPVEGCKTKFAERWKINKHLKMEHKFSSEKVKSTVFKDSMEHNMYFKDLKEIRMRRAVKINTGAREVAKQQRQDYARRHAVTTLAQQPEELAVRRGHYVDIDFNNNQAKVVKRW